MFQFNMIAALLLQANDLGQNAQRHVPGLQDGWSRAIIIAFIVVLAIAAIYAFTHVCRGAIGAARAKSKKAQP